MPAFSEQRPFIPAKDYARSLDFYTRLGWEILFKGDDIALLARDGASFYLQAYYQKEWAENTMLHFTVEDPASWCALAERVKAEGGFDEVRIRAPHHQDYGATVCHVTDPAGVLLHFCKFDEG